MSDSLRPHESQHSRPPCPSPTQTHAHQVSDAIRPSHPLSSPSPPAPNLSQHQGLFQWVSSSYQVAKVLEFQLQHQSFQWTPARECLTVRFLCAVSYLSWALCSLSVPVRGERSRQASPRTEIKEVGCLHRIAFISFSIWWKGLFMTSFLMDHLLALWSLLILASLVTCKVWSLDLYLKKLLVYILLQNSINHLCFIRAWVPVSVFLSISLFLADSLEGKAASITQGSNPGNISLFPSLTFSSSTPDYQVPVH